MLFVVIGTPVRGLTRQQTQEYATLYRQWTPPPGYDIKALYWGSEGSVVTIVDGQTSAAGYEAGLPWTNMEWKVIPVVESAQAVQLQDKVTAWAQKILGS